MSKEEKKIELIHQINDNPELSERLFIKLKEDIQSKLPTHKVSGVTEGIKIRVSINIEGDFLDSTLNAAKDTEAKVINKNTIVIQSTGSDMIKIFNDLAKKWEIFYNTSQKRKGSKKYIEVKRISIE